MIIWFIMIKEKKIIGIREAARMLGVSTPIIYRRMKKLGIKPKVRIVKTVGLCISDLERMKSGH